MSEWQEISTAPRDGTPILLGGGQDDNAQHVRVEEQRLMNAPCRAAWNGEYWVMTFAEAGCVLVTYESPTHWMELPPPPTAEVTP